jgi:hypothetical protein
MKELNNISEELKELQSHLGSLSRNMPYMLPDDYFAALLPHVLQTIQADDMEVTPANWNRSNPYAVPENYFDTFSEHILEQALSNDINALQLPHAVPDGYFDNLPAQLLAAAKETAPSLVVKQFGPKPRHYLAFSNIRWAAAAILLLSVGIAGYNVYQREHSSAIASLNNIPKQDINEYVQQNIDDFDTEMLASNIEPNSTATNEPPTNANQLNDKDIEQYLNETGGD